MTDKISVPARVLVQTSQEIDRLTRKIEKIQARQKPALDKLIAERDTLEASLARMEALPT